MEKHLTAINSSTGQPYTLGKNEIANAVTRLNAERAVKPGGTITVAFLDTAPDYAITSVETYWAKYFPQIDPNTAHPSWAIRITKEYNEAKLIQTTFQAIPVAQRQAIFDQAIKLWQNTYANVNFELITDPAKINQANVRIGLSSAVSQNLTAPTTHPPLGRRFRRRCSKRTLHGATRFPMAVTCCSGARMFGMTRSGCEKQAITWK